MKLLTAQQLGALDELTIKNEPISSIHLMERAAEKCTEYLISSFGKNVLFTLFCGKGNNGGDGIAIARQLTAAGYTARVIVLPGKAKGSADYEKNLARLKKLKKIKILNFSPSLSFDDDKNHVLIDALLGTGFSGELREETAAIIHFINAQIFPVISIDIPSGLAADTSENVKTATAVQADCTLTFHVPKRSMLHLPGSAFSGEIKLLDIGLSYAHYLQMDSTEHLIVPREVAQLCKPRKRESSKWTYGYALLIAGSNDKPGAAAMMSQACIRSGSGLTTLHAASQVGYSITSLLPELMLWPQQTGELPSLDAFSRFTAIGIGPGCGVNEHTSSLLKLILQAVNCPLLLDADALNIIAENKTWLALSSSPKVLTPHKREFIRLTGCREDASQSETDETLREFARKFNCTIILKSAYSRMATPSGNLYINFTGNAGLAKGGSGDVLSGIITSLLAQGYNTTEAAILGMTLQGIAAEKALENQSLESLTATDVTKCLGAAFKTLHSIENNT